jgi:hypothetical protein
MNPIVWVFPLTPMTTPAGSRFVEEKFPLIEPERFIIVLGTILYWSYNPLKSRFSRLNIRYV